MHVRKHLTGGFPCAVMDLSGNLWPLLIPEYSGIKRRGTPFQGWGIQAFPLVVSHYGDKYPLLSLIGIALCFVKSGILTFIFAENNYSWLKHLCSIRALVPLSFFLFLSFSYLSISGWFPGMRAGCVTQGIIASLLLSLQTTSFRPIKGPTHACMLSHFNRVQLFWDPMDCSPPGSSVHGILQAKSSPGGLPCPPPGDLLDLRIKPMSLMSPALAGGFLTSSATISTQKVRHDRKIQRIMKLNVGCGPSSSVKQVFPLSLASTVYTARY